MAYKTELNYLDLGCTSKLIYRKISVVNKQMLYIENIIR